MPQKKHLWLVNLCRPIWLIDRMPISLRLFMIHNRLSYLMFPCTSLSPSGDLLHHKLCINVSCDFPSVPHIQTRNNCVASVHFVGAAFLWGAQFVECRSLLVVWLGPKSGGWPLKGEDTPGRAKHTMCDTSLPKIWRKRRWWRCSTESLRKCVRIIWTRRSSSCTHQRHSRTCDAHRVSMPKWEVVLKKRNYLGGSMRLLVWSGATIDTTETEGN